VFTRGLGEGCDREQSSLTVELVQLLRHGVGTLVGIVEPLRPDRTGQATVSIDAQRCDGGVEAVISRRDAG